MDQLKRKVLDMIAAIFLAEGLSVVESAAYVAKAANFQVVLPDSVPMMYAAGNTVVLNPDSDYWNAEQRQARLLNDYLSGFYSTDDPYHDVLHELGHARHSQNDHEQYNLANGTPVPSELLDEVARSVSEYACFDCRELVAEVYALLRVHQRRQTVPQLSQELLRYYQDIGGVLP
jgi:hypothetical protein